MAKCSSCPSRWGFEELKMLNRRVIQILVSCLFAISTSAIAADAPLADAAERADWPRVEALLKAPADPNVAQIDGMTALTWAPQHDNGAAAKELIAAGASAKSANRYGVTPLSLACTNGN